MAQRGSHQVSRSRGARVRRRFGLTAAKAACGALVCACAAAGAIGLANLPSGFSVATHDSEGSSVVLDGPSDSAAQTQDEGNAANVVSEEEPVAQTRCVVHVDGAVVSPGVYELVGADLRLRDAVGAAGGLLDTADTSALNLAAPLEDGTKVHVPAQGELGDATSVTTVSSGGSGTSTSSGGSASLVNINTATAEELMELPGIGEATAANILVDREQNGPFSSAEDLMRVSGIGEKRFERLKDLICV